ncbi:hypothetical protein [Helicobacter sp. 13S00477-4]|uniref:hypothetical protein n=1 Tax=Helicobacter sp. 13S00477-4 TaxID=1905759 RepID=UPI000BA6C3A1|nr:hypothetical protein [Helicobacter sp. 13S00477-4]PAF52278.1 hypothetical protein BKH44_02930 [Helicobacter sp. 13S00477-4]
MKKFILWFIGSIVFLLVLFYILLFTQIGNDLLKPFVQSQINRHFPIPLELEKFSLRFSNLEASLKHNDDLQIDLKSIFSLWTQKVDGKINIVFDSSIAGVDSPYHGKFKIKSSLKGKFRDLLVHVCSDIADSKTHLQARLKNFSLNALEVDIAHLNLQNLLPLLGQKSYVKGVLKAQANLESDDKKNLLGEAVLQVQDGSLDTALVKNDFKITIPKTDFLLNIEGDFEDKLIKNRFNLNSNLGDIASNGTIETQTGKIDNVYHIDLIDIAPLTPFFKIPLRGNFEALGKIKRVKESLNIEGEADIANSKSAYQVALKNFNLDSIHFDIKKLSINKILWMLYQPQYIDGEVDIKGNVSDFNKNLSLKVAANMTGNTMNVPIKKHLGLDMPHTIFNTQVGVFLNQGIGKMNVEFDSSLGSLKIPKIDLNLIENSFKGDYNLSLPDLKKLHFITGMPMKGAFDLNGKMQYAPNNYFIDFNSDDLGGRLKGILENHHLKADLENIPVENILIFFDVPDVFDAFASGNLDYDLETQKGKLNLIMQNGKFTQNDFTYMIKKYTNFDITKQIFDDVKFSSSLNKKILDAKLNIQNDQLKVDSDKMKIDLGKNKIDSKIKLTFGKDFIYTLLKGDLNAPKVEIDASELLKKETIKAINKGANKVIEKYVPKESQEKVKRILDGVLKNF